MARGEVIVHLEVFEADDWICQLCFRPVNRRLRQPNWWCATLDHIIPLSMGGTHTRDNVQLAHKRCNEAKGCQLAPVATSGV